MADQNLQAFVKAVVAANLFGPLSQLEESFSSLHQPREIQIPLVSELAVSASNLKPLTAQETRTLILRCKILKQEISNFADASSPAAQEKQEQYQAWKRRIRESAAVMIQKRYRGHRVRTPVAQSGRQFRTALDLLWAEIEVARRESGRELPVDNWSVAELRAEKKVLKLALARKHSLLTRKLGRAPVKAEKEVYRPVYAYYHRVKKMLQDAEASAPAPRANPQSTPADSIARLRVEKRDLQTRLNNYEKEFFRLKGRKIKSHEDIRPVLAQWNRYKQVKAQLDKLQQAEEESNQKWDPPSNSPYHSESEGEDFTIRRGKQTSFSQLGAHKEVRATLPALIV